MAKETRPFSGHFPPDDPRTPVTAAGGCTWPTVPAYRYRLVSDNATGILSFLNTTGILYQQSGTPPGHNEMLYTGIILGQQIQSTTLQRSYPTVQGNIMWNLYLHHQDCYFEMTTSGTQSPGKCNVDVPLYEFDCLWAEGSSGDTVRLLQVQFDKQWPESWSPPT